jgi:hypothetical protein
MNCESETVKRVSIRILFGNIKYDEESSIDFAKRACLLGVESYNARSSGF